MIKSPEEILEELIPHYGKLNDQIKSLNADLSKDKDTIKSIMHCTGFKDYSFGGYKVTRQIRHKVSIDEDKMLKVLKEDWAITHGDEPCPYIKTKEYVDSEALESAIYNGGVSQDTMSKLNECKKEVEEVALLCKNIER